MLDGLAGMSAMHGDMSAEASTVVAGSESGTGVEMLSAFAGHGVPDPAAFEVPRSESSSRPSVLQTADSMRQLRHKTDFEALGYLGKGAFGEVLKVLASRPPRGPFTALRRAGPQLDRREAVRAEAHATDLRRGAAREDPSRGGLPLLAHAPPRHAVGRPPDAQPSRVRARAPCRYFTSWIEGGEALYGASSPDEPARKAPARSARRPGGAKDASQSESGAAADLLRGDSVLNRNYSDSDNGDDSRALDGTGALAGVVAGLPSFSKLSLAHGRSALADEVDGDENEEEASRSLADESDWAREPELQCTPARAPRIAPCATSSRCAARRPRLPAELLRLGRLLQ